ncbi:TlpA family protein disulfide reductase [Telmatospirillum siberiense]|uniref:Thioredoxin domain-containing protein n=1 Tax=Telmatospirillum siberiense TaxID=382514 RepID=A0A2N3PNN4_9PROT|nr:TlpA disulfide reductase family protein [Telmatospirillum siberiense]PKU22021.1 hypothetical protein CWS72_23730 [Telmatospirillum siberiense]
MVRLLVTTVVGLATAFAVLVSPAIGGEPGLTYIVPVASESNDGTATRKQLPDLIFADASNMPVHLRQFQGKVVVLNFYTTTCGPCIKQMVYLDRLQGNFRQDVAVVTIAEDQGGVPLAKSFLSRQKLNYLRPFADINTGAALGAAIRGIPTTLVIDKQNRQVLKVEGPVEWDGAMMTSRLRELFDE